MTASEGTAPLPIQIEVWSDVACPWCLLGNAHLREAIRQTGIPANVEMRSFQLSPNLAKIMPVKQYLIEKYGSVERITQGHARLTEMGAKVGLAYNFDKALVANTFDAHRLHHFAKTKGLGAAVMEGLLLAQHTHGGDVSSHDLLLAVALKAGLEEAGVRTLLAGNDFADEVRADVAEGAAIGVQGVPFFVFNRKFALSGAQPVAAFTQALAQAQGASTQVRAS